MARDNFRPPYQLCLALCIPMLLFQMWAWRNGWGAGQFSPTAPANIFVFAAMSTTLFFLPAVAAKHGSSGALAAFILFAIAIAVTGIRTPDWNAEVQQLMRDDPEKALDIQLRNIDDVSSGLMMTLKFGFHSFFLAFLPGLGFNALAIWIHSRYLNRDTTVDQSAIGDSEAPIDIPDDSIKAKLTEDAKTAGLKTAGFIAGVAAWAVTHVFFFGFCYILGARATENTDYFDAAKAMLDNNHNPLGIIGMLICFALLIAPYIVAIFIYNRVRWGFWHFD